MATAAAVALPPTKPSSLGELLSAAHFSSEFIASTGKWRKKRGYMIAVDDPNVLTLITKDFLAHSRFRQSVLSTNMPLAYLAAQGEDTDLGLEDLLLKDLRTQLIGPGFHLHDEWTDVALCCESIEPSATVIQSLGVSKYLNRLALVSVTSLERLTEYLNGLEIKATGINLLRRFICREGNTWSRDSIPVRKSSTLFLGPVWADILQDATDFLSEDTKQFYVDHGIPHVRTYLFHGHPGNGKTSCIKTLASELKLNLYSLNMASSRLDDNGLVDMVHGVLKRSIVAIEDVDRIFNNFTQNETASAVSFSTMINLLDGILSKDGVIFVLTCNHKDQLDEALRRCGRIHREFEFKDASAKVAEDMFLSFYPQATEEAKMFAKKIKNRREVPVASLQEFFMKHRKRTASEAAGDKLDESMFERRRKLDTAVL